jgi:hypothetical protein
MLLVCFLEMPCKESDQGIRAELLAADAFSLHMVEDWWKQLFYHAFADIH